VVSANNAHEYAAPAEMAVTPERSETTIGVDELVVLPSPS
jgi:hypothetical protein